MALDQHQKIKLTLVAGLLADPDGRPKTLERLTVLTMYSPARIKSALTRLMEDIPEIVVPVPWRDNVYAYHIPRRDLYTWGPEAGEEETALDRRMLETILREVNRRMQDKNRRQHAMNQGQGAGGPMQHQQQPQQAAANHPPTVTVPINLGHVQPLQPLQPLLERPPIPVASSPDGSLHPETNELVKRFKEIARQYQHLIGVKKQLDESSMAAGIDGAELTDLRRELIVEPHSGLQNMLFETSQMMADSCGANLPTMSPCTICFDVLQAPQVFQECGHAFCEKCIDRLPWVQSPHSHDWYAGRECPMCRTVSTPIPLYM